MGFQIHGISHWKSKQPSFYTCVSLDCQYDMLENDSSTPTRPFQSEYHTIPIYDCPSSPDTFEKFCLHFRHLHFIHHMFCLRKLMILPQNTFSRAQNSTHTLRMLLVHWMGHIFLAAHQLRIRYQHETEKAGTPRIHWLLLTGQLDLSSWLVDMMALKQILLCMRRQGSLFFDFHQASIILLMQGSEPVMLYWSPIEVSGTI